MTPAEISQYFAIALAALALLGHAKGYFSSSEKEVDARLDRHGEDLKAHDRRIQTIENEMKHLPDRDSQHRIELNMEKINGRLDTLNETLKPIKANGEMLNQLLIEQAKEQAKT